MIKISFVLSNQKIVMRHSDLYNNHSILITILCFVKVSFSWPRIPSEFTLEPLSFPLKTQETHTELPAHFVFLAFEVLGPDEFDTVICLSSASSSSELITISSHAFNCSKDRIHSFCPCNLIAWFGKPFTFNSLFKQKELCRLKLTFFANSSSIDSLALVLSLDTLPTLFQPRDRISMGQQRSLEGFRSYFCQELSIFLLISLHVIFRHHVQPRRQRRSKPRKEPMRLHTCLTSIGMANTLHAVSNNSSLLLWPKTKSDAYKYHGSVKSLKYQQSILNVHSSFVALIYACTGETAPGFAKTVQKLAKQLSEKRKEWYCYTINLIRSKICFALLRRHIYVRTST